MVDDPAPVSRTELDPCMEDVGQEDIRTRIGSVLPSTLLKQRVVRLLPFSGGE